MRRGWLAVGLLLSLGVNLGLLAAVAADRWPQAAPPMEVAEEPAVPSATGADLEIPGAAGEAIDLPAAERAVAERPDASAAAAGPATPGAEPRTHRRGPAAHGGERRGSPEALVERLAEHLGLDGESRDRFVALQGELVATHLEARRERRRLRAELHAELVAAEPDRARLEAITAEMGRVHTASERRSAGLILDSRALLEPAQQRVYLGFLERLHRGRTGGGSRAGHPVPHRRPRH